LREERRLRVFENRVLRRIFDPKRDEVTGEWRKLHNEELRDIYSSPNIVRVIKSRMRCAEHVARMGERRVLYRILAGKIKGKGPLGRPSRILWNPKGIYRIHKCPPPVSILNQPNRVHTPTIHFLKIHPNIILPFTPWSPQWSPPLRLPHKTPVHAAPLPIRATCPSHLILLDIMTRTIVGEEYRS
jgi:hypothetical protein